MHELIAFFICIPMLAVFIPAYSVQMVNDRNMDRVDTIVNAAKEEARQEGYFTSDITHRMVEDIQTLGFEESEISVNVTSTPKYRTETFDDRELINYDIGVNIDKKIAANRMFGISDTENRGVYHVKGAVTSERLSE